MTVRSWALAHDWAPRTVYMVIERWIEDPSRRGRMPLGGINRAIISALHIDLGADIVPLVQEPGRPLMERAA